MFKEKTERIISRLSEHLLGGIIDCKDKTSSWHLIGFPDRSNIVDTSRDVVVLQSGGESIVPRQRVI